MIIIIIYFFCIYNIVVRIFQRVRKQEIYLFLAFFIRDGIY